MRRFVAIGGVEAGKPWLAAEELPDGWRHGKFGFASQ